MKHQEPLPVQAAQAKIPVPLSAAAEGIQYVISLAVKLWVALVDMIKALVEIQTTPLPHN
jgi:hypothetical protein